MSSMTQQDVIRLRGITSKSFNQSIDLAWFGLGFGLAG